MNVKTKKLTTVAMLCAISYVVMLFGRIPMVLFLKYDPKDVIITIGGFIYGPITALLISLCVSVIEMITASDTGIYGLIMNVVSTCAFACTASVIYKHKRTFFGALLGLIFATLFMTGIMLLWNYYITPLYMQSSREAVAALLLPAFLPFNLIKGAMNSAFTMIVYKPVVNTLRKTNLLYNDSKTTEKSRVSSLGICLCSIFVIICLFMIINIIW